MQQFIYQETSHIVFLREGDDAEKNRNILSAQMEEMNEKHPIILLCQSHMDKICSYENIFTLDSDMVCGVAFSQDMISKTGSFNGQLPADTGLLELCCRLAREAGSSCFVSAEQNQREAVITDQHAEELGFTYAYIVRSHMNELRDRNMLDAVFQDICSLMQQKGCFTQFQKYMNYFLTNQDEYERIAGYTAPFLVLRGDDTCGGVLQQFADDLTEALASNGQAVLEISRNYPEYDKLQGMLSKGIIGFQSRALEIDFFRKMRGPKFQFWFDNPLHFTDILRNLPEDQYVLCQDANYAEAIRRYYHTPNAIQFPPGGKEMPWQKEIRPYDVVFIGSYFSDETNRLDHIQKQFYSYMIQHPQLTFEQGVEQLTAQWEIQQDTASEMNTDEQFIQRMLELKPACRAVIGYFRNKVLATILDADITLHVYGDSWQLSPFQSHKNFILHPQISMEDSIAELHKAKIGLNIMSWHKAGMTERIANIMLSGAVCLSDETTYIRENIKEGEEIALYRLDELEKLPEQIKELLENESQRENIAQKGYEKAVREFSWNARAKQLIKLAESRLQPEESIRIFVATHVAFNPPENPIYVPLHVGRSGKQDLGYQGDDTGENISDLNFLYGELTGLYWIWQNVNDLDYAGLCHYRRYFINTHMQEMQKEEYLSILQEYDAIVPKHMECDGGCTYYEQFGKAHNSHDLDAVEHALKKLYPEYADAYDQAMQGHIFYWGNLMVTSMPILKAYAEWLFTIFVETGEEIDVSGYDAYHKRVYGFLSEQMFYVFALANHLQLCEVAVGVSAEKAETAQLKTELKRLMQEDRMEEACSLFAQQLRMRPDLLLPGSDVNHELQNIYEQLKRYKH